jgi:TolA-binding protein
MRTSIRLSSRSVKTLLLAGALFVPALSAHADTVYIQSNTTGKPLARPNVMINKIAKDKDDDFESLYYTTDGGQPQHKELSKVAQIEADGEPVFNQAETEFANGDLKAAGEDYRRAMSNTAKDWVKHRSDVRLLGISAKTGDFVGAVAGYVEMARKDPVTAAAQKPAVTSAKPDQLSSAITLVNRGLVGASVETKIALYSYLIELQNKNGDTAGASATIAALKSLHPTQSAVPNSVGVAVAESPDAMVARQAEAETALTRANASLAAHEYDKVIEAINGASASFVDPDHQAKALYLLAEAKAATATTPDALEDAALAYMRAVAHFKSQPGGPAADALYKTGVIEEKLAKTREAVLIYNQVITEYSDSKVAAEAKAAVARLSK